MVASPRRPATTTQLAEVSSGTSYAAQNAAVSASSGSIAATQHSIRWVAIAAVTGAASSSGCSEADSQSSVPLRGAVTRHHGSGRGPVAGTYSVAGGPDRRRRSGRSAARRLRAAARDVAAAVAGERARAVHRRGREGHPPGGRGGLPAAVVPAGAALAAGSGRRPGPLARRPGVRRRASRWPNRSPASTSIGARWPRCTESSAAPLADLLGVRPAGRARGRRRPHQRRGDHPLRRRARLGRRAARAAGGGPALSPSRSR